MAVFAKKWWQNDFADDVIPSNGAVPTWDTARQQWRPLIPGSIVVNLPTVPPFKFTDNGVDTAKLGIGYNGLVYMAENASNAFVGVQNNGVGYVEIDAGSTESYLFVHATTGQTTGLLQVQDDDDSKILTFVPARSNPTRQEPSFVGPAGDASQGWIAIAPGNVQTDFTVGFGTGTGYISLFANAAQESVGIQAQAGQTAPLLALSKAAGTNFFTVDQFHASGDVGQIWFGDPTGSLGGMNIYLTNSQRVLLDLFTHGYAGYLSLSAGEGSGDAMVFGYPNTGFTGNLVLFKAPNSGSQVFAINYLGGFGAFGVNPPAAQSAAGTTAADAIACLKAFGLMHA